MLGQTSLKRCVMWCECCCWNNKGCDEIICRFHLLYKKKQKIFCSTNFFCNETKEFQMRVRLYDSVLHYDKSLEK